MSMDSATEFLFGIDVCSLSAGLPYPLGTPNTVDGNSHSSNTFSKAFNTCQRIISSRSLKGFLWPLAELWKDETKEPMHAVDSFIDPIVEDVLMKKREALRSKELSGTEKPEPEEVLEDGDSRSMLEHLVNVTEGIDIAYTPMIHSHIFYQTQ